jgi:pilus assembly protein Flp/PilA
MKTNIMQNFIQRFIAEEDGATMIEYALLAALISIAAIAALTSVGTEVKNIFNVISTTLAAA